VTATDLTDVPSCRIGYTCASRGWRPEFVHQHLASCPMSDSSAVHRLARIDALTFAELRTLVMLLAATAPVVTDVALADADTVRELLPEHMPEGAL
jgi:hypothetical protein